MTITAPIAPTVVKPPLPANAWRQTLPCEVRAIRADGKPTVITGKIKYDVRSKPIYGAFFEIVRRGAFGRALRGEDDPRGLVNHDDAKVISRLSAKTLRLFDDTDGLRWEMDVADTSYGRDLVVSVERGDINNASFGFRKIKDKWTEEKSDDGIMYEVRELLEVELFDISPCAFPAYPDNTVAMRCLEERKAAKAAAAAKPLLQRARLRMAEAEG